ncbi:MAG: phenylacetate--CoA ligase [Chlorobium sp.]|jgi:phenylacetate-CoA ligase|uniref:phenylacetate--CoA ligase family protein n=1 Tax=Chlorobium sp. TaxID=1095 RepID=UPI0025BDF1E9|nr:phenylacetate--CoA ligase [Chlorobium sp.]MCF8216366.1 phenylacetate--CoA ligase [Chlorobium sp.]MCF8271269.1 phenylacetate--CoA ligase [Chlorobium sp.]MCF8287643.1 phenylacetate--CoA ligase [Chlorobium sp.]MCF8291182.1 phenylacetate--CoA ligase [Chlorobium sp.]MCF8385277.1 phenylacetate--CoA ligase [Chlorobium sp.]
MIWNAHYECMEREELRNLQGERLQAMVEKVYFNVPFYRLKLQEKGIEPGDIRTIDDLQKLPFTTKQDLRDNYPFGLFAVPQQEIVRLHASSGTTGKSTVVGYTHNDILMWSEVVARSLTMAGVTKSDIIQVAYGYGLFTGGLGLHYGAEKIGASVIPISGGNTKKQLQLMEDFGSTAIACTPSYAAYLGEALAEEKIDRKNIRLKAGIFGAEPWTEEMRAQIERLLGLKAYDIYGLSEVIGPGVSMECQCQKGMHIFEDHFIPEIIDPETGDVLPYGELGELVFTTVTKEAMPLVRYRTRDLTRLHAETCQCGRTLVRMEKCVGRSDDMLIIRGVNVFPSQIESVLLEMSETKPHYLLVVDRENNLDTIEIQVEVEEQFFSDEVKDLEDLRRRIHANIASLLGLSASIRLVEPGTIERSMGKAQRVVDKRKLK